MMLWISRFLTGGLSDGVTRWLRSRAISFPLAVLAMLGVGVVLGALARTAYAATYSGSGWFHKCDQGLTCDVDWDEPTTQWVTAISRANADWSSTDINTRKVNTSDWDLYFKARYYNSNQAGWAIIGNPAGSCSGPPNPLCPSAVVNNPYQWCIAHADRSNLGSYTTDEKQDLAAHEFGHCWSLNHVSRETSIMGPNPNMQVVHPDASDKANINLRY